MRLREILASNLRRLRDLKGLSQETLADMAEIDRSYMSYLENLNRADNPGGCLVGVMQR